MCLNCRKLMKTCAYLRNRNIFISIVICGVIIFYNIRYSEQSDACHYQQEGDLLQSAECIEFSPKPNSIFFHETSCRGGLTPRQACVIESAARLHPKRNIFVLFSAPVTRLSLLNNCLNELFELQNIKYARVHIQEYAKNTPLEKLVASRAVSKSRWWVEHTSDVLRLLTLYKWGGVYLDTDMFVVKSLSPLGRNWVAKEEEDLVNGAAVAISMGKVGRKLVNALLNEVRDTYKPDMFLNNGPDAFSRVVYKLCSTDTSSPWTSSKSCGGFKIYDPKYIYPTEYVWADDYFYQGELNYSIVKNAYIHHLWNKITRSVKVQFDSPLAKMAAKFCPIIYNIYIHEFGGKFAS